MSTINNDGKSFDWTRIRIFFEALKCTELKSQTNLKHQRIGNFWKLHQNSSNYLYIYGFVSVFYWMVN